MSKGMFADFYPCPICYPKYHRDTRFYCYSKDNREDMKHRKMRVVYCEGCGMLRFQVRSGSDKWVFGSITGQPIEMEATI